MEVCEKMDGSVHVRLTSFDSDIKYFLLRYAVVVKKQNFIQKKFYHSLKVVMMIESHVSHCTKSQEAYLRVPMEPSMVVTECFVDSLDTVLENFFE